MKKNGKEERGIRKKRNVKEEEKLRYGREGKWRTEKGRKGRRKMQSRENQARSYGEGKDMEGKGSGDME